MKYIFYKASTEIIAMALTVILLTGNLVSCSPRKINPEKPSSTPSDTTYSEDTTIYAEDTVTYAEKTQTYAEEQITLSEDMITYTEEVTYYIEDMVFYEFGEYVDDMYVVVLHTQDYIDEHTVIYDPETGRQFNIGPVLAKIAMGAAVIIACVAITVATGGTAASSVPFMLKIAIPYVKVASAGAATGAAISGAISYISSGGNIEKTFYGAIEGAADGFMWGAILSPGAVNLAKLQLGKATAPIRETARYKNFSQITRESVRRIGDKVDDIIRPVTNMPAKVAECIDFYTGEVGFRKINGVLRARGNNPKIREQAAIISNYLKTQPLVKNTRLYRGESMGPDLIATRYGAENISGKTMDEIVNIMNNTIKKGKNIPTTELGFTSTSQKWGDTVNRFAFHKQHQLEIPFVTEIRIGNNGVTGANISNYSRYRNELEVLLDTNLRKQPINAYKEVIFFNGKRREVIHVVEQIP